jgi:hypothetical protein
MKKQILEISKRLENETIDYIEARKEFCVLFGVKYSQVFKGRAKVKSKKQKWIYEGSALPIIGLHTPHKNGYGLYPDGTREFRLSLIGTEFEYRNGKRQKTTVIPETDLEILELEEQ